ncbi:MAG TPA: hypothetical protein VF540_06970 [Segetibacter sp.]
MSIPFFISNKPYTSIQQKLTTCTYFCMDFGRRILTKLKEAFVQMVTEGLAAAPDYFPINAKNQ